MNHKYQIEKFIAAHKLFLCPLCGSPLQPSGNSLRCGNGHCFDIASKGYVNFISGHRQMNGYDGPFFESRKKILDAGFYTHILEGMKDCLHTMPALTRILDAGCGEGYYARSIQESTGKQVIAFDYSKDAIQLAAKGGSQVLWLVSDLTRIPIRGNRIDCLLNIFTPANYSEFKRVLKTDGILIKVIPGPDHLTELRHAVKDHIKNDTHSNQQVKAYFQKHFSLHDEIRLSRTITVPNELRNDLYRMTPLLFGVPSEVIKRLDISEITIDAEVLIGNA